MQAIDSAEARLAHTPAAPGAGLTGVFADAAKAVSAASPFAAWVSSEGGAPVVGAGAAEPWREGNGVHLSGDGTTLTVHTDNFGTTPVLLDLEARAFAPDFAHLPEKRLALEDIDQVAFWESMIFDYPLGMRTMHRGVLQVPGGTRCDFRPDDGSYHARRWNLFDRLEPSESGEDLICAIEERLQTLCRGYWRMLPKDGYLLLPLSGGLDSRLLALNLAHTGPAERIKAVTFGFSKGTKEVQIAAQVCRELGIATHLFHPLPRTHYAGCTGDFWRNWRGALTVNHAHLFSFLRSHKASGAVLVSGFYADAVAGYAASVRRDPALRLEASNAYRRLVDECMELRLERHLCDGMQEDFRTLYAEWLGSGCPFSFDEFLYLSQRQAKTFSLLLQLYRAFCPVVAPYGDPLLARLFLSAPYPLRREKFIIRRLMERHSGRLSVLGDVSSAVASHTPWHRMRAGWKKYCSRLAILGNVVSGDRLRHVSSYCTEDVFGALRRESRPEILAVLERLHRGGMVTDHQYRLLKPKPLRGPEVTRHARLLTFAPSLNGAEQGS